jgi:hypothetical protein
MATARNAYMERYRFDRKGNVVRDTRRMSIFFLDPHGTGYTTGMPLFEPRRSSPARLAFQAHNNRRTAA